MVPETSTVKYIAGMGLEKMLESSKIFRPKLCRGGHPILSHDQGMFSSTAGKNSRP